MTCSGMERPGAIDGLLASGSETAIARHCAEFILAEGNIDPVKVFAGAEDLWLT